MSEPNPTTGTYWEIGTKKYTCKMLDTADCGYGIVFNTANNFADFSDFVTNDLLVKLINPDSAYTYTGVKLTNSGGQCICPAGTFTKGTTNYTLTNKIMSTLSNNFMGVYNNTQDKIINTKLGCTLTE